VQVEVVSGSVELYLYGLTRIYLDGIGRHAWIALAPSTTLYFEVRSTGATSTSYRVRISKRQLNGPPATYTRTDHWMTATLAP